MDFTPSTITRSQGQLKTPSLRSTLEADQSQKSFHRNAKVDHANLDWKSDEPTSTGKTRKGSRLRKKHRADSVMDELSNAFSSTGLDEISAAKEKALVRKLRMKQQKALREAVAAAKSPAQREKKAAKRKAKKLRASEKKKLKNLVKRTRKMPRPHHSGASPMAQLIQDNQRTPEEELKKEEGEEDVEEEVFDMMGE